MSVFTQVNEGLLSGSSPVGVATFPPPSSFCRFARAFQCEIGSITPSLVQRFLNDLNLSARSVNNFRKTLKTLFEFARVQQVPLKGD